jgi:hypothetical protein
LGETAIHAVVCYQCALERILTLTGNARGNWRFAWGFAGIVRRHRRIRRLSGGFGCWGSDDWGWSRIPNICRRKERGEEKYDSAPLHC